MLGTAGRAAPLHADLSARFSFPNPTLLSSLLFALAVHSAGPKQRPCWMSVCDALEALSLLQSDGCVPSSSTTSSDCPTALAGMDDTLDALREVTSDKSMHLKGCCSASPAQCFWQHLPAAATAARRLLSAVDRSLARHCHQCWQDVL